MDPEERPLDAEEVESIIQKQEDERYGNMSDAEDKAAIDTAIRNSLFDLI